MTEAKDIKVGDVVAWPLVPDGALVRWLWAQGGHEFYWRRHAHVASLVGTHTGEWCKAGKDNGSFAPDEPVTVVALGVPADATAEHLRELAERFEVREATFMLDEFEMPADLAHYLEELAEDDESAARDMLADRLHRAGWRPGMTAEDAARLLAAQDER